MKTWSWRQLIIKTELESTTKLVLLALSTYMNDHGEGCYPSTLQIAKDTSLSERAVFAHIRKAEIAGFLIRDKRELKGKKWAANEYRAAYPDHNEPRSVENTGMNEMHPTPSDELYSSHDALRDEPDSAMGCTTFRQGMNDVHTNSPENSSMNSKELSPGKEKLYPDAFEQFWKTWPEQRRCEKPNAYKAWCESCKKAPVEALMEALERYVLTKEAMEGFAPYPAKWLKRERWLEFTQTADASPLSHTLDGSGDDTPENNTWRAILNHLHVRHGEAVYRSWFRQLHLVGTHGSVLTLRAPNRFVAQWVQSHYGADITRAAQGVWPDITHVRIECGASLSPHDKNRRFPTEKSETPTPA